MSTGSWVLRAGVYSMLFAGLFALNQIFPYFLETLANTIFFWQGSEYFASQKLLELYAVFFGIGTLIALGAEGSIKSSIQETGR